MFDQSDDEDDQLGSITSNRVFSMHPHDRGLYIPQGTHIQHSFMASSP